MRTRRTLVLAFWVMSLPLAFAAAQESTASLRGTVTDSIRHGPLAGATVVASTTAVSGAGDFHDYTALTDARGKFSMTALPPGMYLLTVEHPWLDSTGLGVPARKVDLLRQRDATMNLAVPSSTTIRAVFCQATVRDTSIGLVAGYVKDAHSDHPVAGARVVFVWGDFDVDRRTARASPRERTAAATTGSDGTFRICGLPVQRTMLMQAQSGDRAATGAVEVEVPASGVLVETLRLDAGVAGTTSIAGAVRREGSQAAIAAAHVHLLGAASETVAARDGSFILDDVPFGTQSIEVTALGFYPRRLALDVTSVGMNGVTIMLAEMGGVLDSVRIVGNRGDVLALHGQFDERRAHGSGQYITQAMIADAHPIETAELMQQVSGYYVMSDTVYSSRGITRIEPNAEHVCKPTVYIDGGLAARTMNDIVPNTIYGIEIYSSAANVPPQYPSANCGAILIWTK